MSEEEFILIDHARSMPRLEGTMRRVGARCDPSEFVREVSNAFHAADASRYDVDMPRYFRTLGSEGQFREALLAAKARLGPRPRILDVGCGTGYDLEIIDTVWPAGERGPGVACDISGEMLAIARSKPAAAGWTLLAGEAAVCAGHAPFDLIVTHSFLHHVAALHPLLERLDRWLAPGGSYVMAHEPNARYWRNPECLRVLNRLRREQAWRDRLAKYLDPRRYVSKGLRLLRLATDSNIEDEVNRLLRGRVTFGGDLTPQEVRRLVDVHLPDDQVGDFTIGADGLDWEDLRARCLPDCKVLVVRTLGYAGKVNPADLSRRWRRVNDALAARHPLDGSIFSCALAKPGRR